jgi:CheY-like chemotaxis protein
VENIIVAAYNLESWIVLVVDDEHDNLGVVEKILTFYGAKVHIAMNGLEGLAILDTLIPTFILLDLSMPGMDGWETFKKIRANSLLTLVPVIALTAHAMPADEIKVLEAGFNGYIPKPLRLDTFLGKIQSILASR